MARQRRLPRVAAVAALTLTTVVCLLHGVGAGGRGAGDNGDGARLFCGAGLRPATVDGRASWTGWVETRFQTGTPPCADPAPSSALVFLRVAVAAGGDGVWDLRTLGLLYAVLITAVVAAAAVIASARRPAHALVLLPVVLPLAAPSFSRFLVSTYGEPAGLLGAVALLAGLAALGVAWGDAGAGRRTGALALVVGGGVVGATAKPGYAPLLVAAVAVCLVTALRRPGRTGRLAGVVAAVLAVAVAIGPIATATERQQRWYGAVNTHNLVFTAVGPGSRGDALVHLGLGERADRLGTAYYPEGAGGPGWQAAVGDRWPELRDGAARYVLTHPRTAWHLAAVALRATADPRLPYLPASPADAPGARPTPVPTVPVGEQGAARGPLLDWLDSRPAGRAPAALCAIAVLVACASLRWRPRGPVGVLVTLGLVAVATGAVLAVAAVAGDGFFEVAKHVWLSAYLGTVAVLALGGAAVAAVAALVAGADRSGRTGEPWRASG